MYVSLVVESVLNPTNPAMNAPRRDQHDTHDEVDPKDSFLITHLPFPSRLKLQKAILFLRLREEHVEEETGHTQRAGRRESRAEQKMVAI